MKKMERALYLNKVDHLLRVLSEVRDGPLPGQHTLKLTLFYQNDNMGTLDFTLNGYAEHEIHDLAQNIKKNGFIMKEIDDYLCSDIE